MSTGLHSKGRAVAVALFSLLAVSTADAQQAAKRWEFTATPYLWATWITGDVGIRDIVADVDVTFGEILDKLRFAGMAELGARYDRWQGALDAIYLSVASDKSVFNGDRTRDVDVALKVWIVQPTLGYTVWRSPAAAVDVVAGARYWNFRPHLTVERVGQAPRIDRVGTSAWVDATLGANWTMRTSNRWMFNLAGDGGAGGSNNSWQALGLAGYDLSTRWTLAGGFRYLTVDRSHDNRLLDVRIYGPILTGTYRF